MNTLIPTLDYICLVVLAQLSKMVVLNGHVEIHMYNWCIVVFSVRNKYDFLDLGCKKGGSIGWCQKKYGGKGLGVDLNQDSVNEAVKSGYEAICSDVLKLKFRRKSFRYVAMMDFLEHLPDEKAAKSVLKKCKKWSSEFFFIHHPSFESVGYLKKHGLKIDWTDGYNHTCPLTIKDFERIFKELGIKNYKITRTKPILDSSDPHIIPLDSPHDTHLYSKELGPKPLVKFDKPVFGRVEIMVNTQSKPKA